MTRPSDPRALSALCIDDSLFDLKLNERILMRCGAFAEITQFPNARDALDHMRTGHRPDVIFLDVNMPCMDGFEFLQAATEEFGSAFDKRVVVMLTSSLNPNDRARAEAFAVVQAFLSKPLTVDSANEIADAIRKLSAPSHD